MSILNADEVRGLSDALDDEFRAHETYLQVIRDFGEVRPFINIVQAEQRHIDALLSLFDKYGVEPPENRWAGKVPRYDSIGSACAAGVQAEIDNVAIYDRVLKSTARDDILAVYRSLQAASQDRHLPAFQRCAEAGNVSKAEGGSHGE